jgi:hypothetical protein
MAQEAKFIFTFRRRIVSQLETAPVGKRVGLRAALRGIDLLLRTNFDIRRGGRWRVERN